MAPSPKQLFDTALAHQHAGRLAEAAPLYERVLAQAPNDLPTRANYAITLAQLGRHAEASAQFERALALKPDDAALRQNLLVTALNAGTTAMAAGKPAEAVDAFERAIKAAPERPDVHGSLGLARAGLGDIDGAAQAFEVARALAPDDARLHYNLGCMRRDQGQAAHAITCYREAIRLQPDYVEALCQLGSLMRLDGDPGAALELFARAAAAQPDFAVAEIGRGGALHDLGRLDEAVAAFRRAQALEPGNAEAHRSEALSLLLKGDFAAGWSKLEWRWRGADQALRQQDAAPWDGSDPAGRTLLLYAEQGLGDTIQFARYVPLLAARGARVILQVQRPLLPLLGRLDGVTELIAARQGAPASDAQAPLMSLPHLLGTTLETVPAPVPYLTADPAQRAAWRDDLAADGGIDDGLAVGLVWAGNPRHARDQTRSLPARALLPLLGLAPVRWFSLQVGPRAADLASLPDIADLAPHLTDFAETAAAICALDLVITVDTAVAHLAGALGKPVWLMLPHAPDYRWLLGRDDSPWYPTMRLFRQPGPGAWDAVIAAIVVNLSTHMREMRG